MPLLYRFLNLELTSKIIFSSGDYSETLPSSELLKVAPIFSLQQIERLIASTPDLKLHIPKAKGPKLTSGKLKKNVSPVKDYAGTILIFAKTAGIDFPPTLVDTASDFAAHLSFYFNEVDAVAISIEIILVPYALGKFGRELCASFCRSINIRLENKLVVA